MQSTKKDSSDGGDFGGFWEIIQVGNAKLNVTVKFNVKWTYIT